MLEFRVIDYEPTDFLTGTYYDETHPSYGEPKEYPMRVGVISTGVLFHENRIMSL